MALVASDNVYHGFFQVCFRYEPQQKDSPEWSQAVEKCLEAIDLPMIGKDRSEYGRSVSDLLSDEPSLQNSWWWIFEKGHLVFDNVRKDLHSSIPKVRIFKKGTNLPNGVVWNTENDQKIDDAKELDARIHRALLRVLEKVQYLTMVIGCKTVWKWSRAVAEVTNN